MGIAEKLSCNVCIGQSILGDNSNSTVPCLQSLYSCGVYRPTEVPQDPVKSGDVSMSVASARRRATCVFFAVNPKPCKFEGVDSIQCM